MSAYGTKLAEAFSQKVAIPMYDRSLLEVVTNDNYKGEINGVGSVINVLDFDKISEKTYVKSGNGSPDAITENNCQLTIDQYKMFYWAEYTIDQWKSYIKEPSPKIADQCANERNKNKDSFVFGLYGDVGAGHWVGTDYSTGTVDVTATTGAVAGNGTTFTAAMVGRPFKATGHSTWYRVSAYTSATAITIVDDEDDVTAHYSGGTISGATYTIQAATVQTITTSNLLAQVGQLKLKLDLAEKNGYSSVPDTNRFLIVPPEFVDMVPRASGVALHVPEVYSGLIQKGMVTQLSGFNVFVSNRLTGNNTDGYYVLAGSQNWMTFADKLLQARMEEDIDGDFGTAYKDLYVYGAKVKDCYRHQAALGFWKF